MKKLAWILILTGLIGACAYVSFNYLIWFIPTQPNTREIALADLDGDGDLDAFLANGRHEDIEPNTVLFNDGTGRFHDSDQRLGQADSSGAVIHDFDDDGDVDALVSNFWGEYYWNDGDGFFKRSQEIPVPTVNGLIIGRWRFRPADLNGDGRFDLFLTGCCGGGISEGPDNWTPLNAYNTVSISGDGKLPRYSGQQFGVGSSEAVDVADLDGDGDLDAFTANSAHLSENDEAVEYDPNIVWLNDGQGHFTDSGQQLGEQRSYAIALGDLDGDGDSDAFFGNRGHDEIWLNDGQAGFTNSGQKLSDRLTRFLYLADLDGDGDLDAFAGDNRRGQIWLNDGRGVFTASGQVLRYGTNHAVSIGDVDGDGDVDISSGRVDDIHVWFNDGAGRME